MNEGRRLASARLLWARYCGELGPLRTEAVKKIRTIICFSMAGREAEKEALAYLRGAGLRPDVMRDLGADEPLVENSAAWWSHTLVMADKEEIAAGMAAPVDVVPREEYEAMKRRLMAPAASATSSARHVSQRCRHGYESCTICSYDRAYYGRQIAEVAMTEADRKGSQRS